MKERTGAGILNLIPPMEKKRKLLMKKYDVGRLLGQGTFAKVYHGRNIKTGESVAIKVIDKEKVLKVGLINQTIREISIMGLIKHPNVTQLYEVMATKTKIYFVMEYAKGGELFSEVAKGKLKEDVARKYFQELISAVSFCHSRGVYHRDLKPENLLLDENGVLKVSDFGLSALSESRQQHRLLHTTCGTPAYVAPEVIRRKGYNGAPADIWSCGVILFVLLSGYLPFHDSNIMEMYRKISRADYKCPNWFPPDARRLLSRILDPNPHSRISMADIIKDSWFQKGRLSCQHARQMPLAENDVILKPSIRNCVFKSKEDQLPKATNLNAFDIIALSTEFDLSGFFVSKDQKDEVQFTSTKSASTITSKIEDMACSLKLKVTKKDHGSMRLEGSFDEDANDSLTIDIEMFEITPSFHLVELKRSCGHTLAYQRLLKQQMKPALQDIVWSWQGKLSTL